MFYEKYLFYKIVLIACSVSALLFNICENGPIILQSTEYSLQLLIKYLTSFQFYIGEKRMEMLYEELSEENRHRKIYSARTEETCPQHSYRVRIVNRKPLIIYIENFLTQTEINHLIELT